MIVVVAAEKGGTGKSTLAVHLAGWGVRADKAVKLVDADRQGTASIRPVNAVGHELWYGATLADPRKSSISCRA